MVKTFKKAFSVFLAMALLTVLVAGVALSVSATLPGLFEFDTWTGSGTVSVNMDIEQNRFISLEYDGEEVALSNYAVTGTDDSTVIALKEEYLKTLELDNGEYFFGARFSADGMEFSADGIVANTPNEIIFSGETSTLIRITHDDEEIDSSNYTVTVNEMGTVVVFNEGYLETITGEGLFVGYFSYESYPVVLRLNVDIQSATDISTTVASQTETANDYTVPFQYADDPPQTGYQSIALLIIIISLSITVFVIALATRRNKVNAE